MNRFYGAFMVLLAYILIHIYCTENDVLEHSAISWNKTFLGVFEVNYSFKSIINT